MEVEEKQIRIVGEASRRAVAEMCIQIQNQHSPDPPTAKVVNADSYIVHPRQGPAVGGICMVAAAAKHPGHSIR